MDIKSSKKSIKEHTISQIKKLNIISFDLKCVKKSTMMDEMRKIL